MSLIPVINGEITPVVNQATAIFPEISEVALSWPFESLIRGIFFIQTTNSISLNCMGLELAQRLGLGGFSLRSERSIDGSRKGPTRFVTRVAKGVIEEVTIDPSGRAMKKVHLFGAPSGDLDALLDEINKYQKKHGRLRLRSDNGKV